MLWIGGEKNGNVRSRCEEDDGTYCANGKSDTHWQREIESDMICVLSV